MPDKSMSQARNFTQKLSLANVHSRAVRTPSSALLNVQPGALARGTGRGGFHMPASFTAPLRRQLGPGMSLRSRGFNYGRYHAQTLEIYASDRALGVKSASLASGLPMLEHTVIGLNDTFMRGLGSLGRNVWNTSRRVKAEFWWTKGVLGELTPGVQCPILDRPVQLVRPSRFSKTRRTPPLI